MADGRFAGYLSTAFVDCLANGLCFDLSIVNKTDQKLSLRRVGAITELGRGV